LLLALLPLSATHNDGPKKQKKVKKRAKRFLGHWLEFSGSAFSHLSPVTLLTQMSGRQK